MSHGEIMVEGTSKRGRKRLDAAEAPRPVLSFRIRADLDEKLRTEAMRNSLALSEEVEGRLFRSLEADAVQAELRGTIAALERRISDMERADHLLWPDDSAHALGEAFAMALNAARHATGEDWREDPAIGLILAGTVRRMVDRVSRTSPYGSLVTALSVDGARIAATAERIVETVGPYLDKNMPPLPEPALDVAQWTGRARHETEFRDAASGKVLAVLAGPEYDAVDPEQRAEPSADLAAAIDRFRPMRHRVEIEAFAAHVMRDGSVKRLRVSFKPADAPPVAEAGKHLPPGMEWATLEEADAAVPIPGLLPPEIGDRAKFEEAMGLERPDDPPPPASEPDRPAPKRRGKAKVSA